MSAVLPAPNPTSLTRDTPAVPAKVDAGSAPSTRGTGTWSTVLPNAQRGKAKLVLFAAAGALLAFGSTFVTPPRYEASALIEIRGTGVSGATFVDTQAKLIQSQTLHDRAVLRVERENPGAGYVGKDRFGHIRSRIPFAALLPPVAILSAVPVTLVAEPLGDAQVLQLHAEATDGTFAARFVNALAAEYAELEGAPAAAGSSTGDDWPETYSRLVDAAVAPTKPIPGYGYWMLVWGALAGGMVGFVGLAAQAPEQALYLRMPGDIGNRLQLRELGAIPWAGAIPDHLPGEASPVNPLIEMALGRRRRQRSTAAETAVWEDQASVIAEAFRGAATSLLLAKSGTRSNAIVVTSAHRGEGKTTVALNLSAALADLGLKVLLLDADLRNPRLHQILDLPNSWGLSDLLQERRALVDAPMETLVRKCSVPNVSVVCAGPPALNVGGLLYSDQMEQLMARFRREFDMIVIDTPPALFLADARLTSRLADAVAVVVRAGRTEERDVNHLCQKLTEDGRVVAGALLNGWRMTVPASFHESQSGEHEAFHA